MKYLRMDVQKSLRVLGSMMTEIDTWKHLSLAYFDQQLEDEIKQILPSDRCVYEKTLNHNEKPSDTKSKPVFIDLERDCDSPVASKDCDSPASVLIDTSLLKSRSLERLLSEISNLSSYSHIEFVTYAQNLSVLERS